MLITLLLIGFSALGKKCFVQTCNNYLFLGLGLSANKNLVSFPEGNSRSSEVCCKDKNIKSCVNTAVDKKIDKDGISILDIDLAFHSTVSPNGFVYKNPAGDEAVITYNNNTGNMFGSFKTHQDKSYALEPCHHGYVWKEYDISSFGPDIALGVSVPDIPRMKKFVETGVVDNTTKVTYSVMIYVSIKPQKDWFMV